MCVLVRERERVSEEERGTERMFVRLCERERESWRQRGREWGGGGEERGTL